MADGGQHRQGFGQGVYLGFEQIADGAQIHAAVAVFGEKAHAEIFHLIARARHQQAVDLAVVIQRGHAQAGAGVGHGQVFIGGGGVGHAALELLESGR